MTPGREQVHLLQGLVQAHPIYGSAGQNAAAALLERQLHAQGWDKVWRDPYTAAELVDMDGYVPVEEFGEAYSNDAHMSKTNILAAIDSGKPGPTIVMNGHYDVDSVSTPEAWSLQNGWRSGQIVDGQMIGRGTSDMLGGLTSLIAVGSKLAATKETWRGRLVLAAVTDEEIGGNGTLHSLINLERLGVIAPRDEIVGLIAEPSDQIIANESLGFMHLKAVARRQSVHMGMAERSNNALYDVIDLVNGFDTTLQLSADRLGKADRAAALVHNFGIIEAGIDAALPMGRVDTEATIFYPADIARSELQQALQQVVKERHEGVIDLSFSGFGFEGHTSANSQLGQALATTPTDLPLTRGLFKSPCDARLLTRYGIDDVTIYGPGSLVQAHAVDEHIELSDLGHYNDHLHRTLQTMLSI